MTSQTSTTPRVGVRQGRANPFRTAVRRVRASDLTARRLLPVGVLAVGMVVNAVILVMHSSRVWFWADDWDLLFLRGTIPEYDEGLLAPHNSHWFTAHVLVYRAIFMAFGMGSYTPYAVTEVCFHLAVVAVSYALLRRVGAGPWISVLTALVITFFGLGANAEVYAASMNHVGALLFGLVAVLVAASGRFDVRTQVLASGALLLSVMFGLTGLAMLVLVATFVAAQHGLVRAARLVAPPALVFVAWWVTFGRSDGVNSVSPTTDLSESVPKIPSYVWTGLTGTLGDGSGLTGAGPLLVIALFAFMLVSRAQPTRLVHLAWAGIVADIFQLVVVGVARFDFGPTQLGTSHYSYINIVLLAPAIALAGTQLAQWLGEPRWRSAVLAAALLVAYALNSVTYVQKWQDDFATLTGGGKDLALGIVAAMENDQRVLSQRNPDRFNKQLIPRYVGTPQIRDALPDKEPTANGLLSAESYFFTGVSEKDYAMARPADLTPYAGFAAQAFERGCQPVQATGAEPILELQTGDEGNEIVVWSNSTNIKTRLVRGKDEGPTMDWKAEPGAMHIATSAPDATMFISFNGSGTFTVCVA